MHDQTQLVRHDDIAAIEWDVEHGQADAHGVDGCAGIEADEEGAVLCSECQQVSSDGSGNGKGDDMERGLTSYDVHRLFLDAMMAKGDVELGEDAHAKGVDGLGRHAG